MSLVSRAVRAGITSRVIGQVLAAHRELGDGEQLARVLVLLDVFLRVRRKRS